MGLSIYVLDIVDIKQNNNSNVTIYFRTLKIWSKFDEI